MANVESLCTPGFSFFIPPRNPLMSAVLAYFEETIDPVTLAVREYHADPSISVTKLCKARGISRATFYRRRDALKAESPLPQVEEIANAPEFKSCPNACGTMLPAAASKVELLTHAADECSNATDDLRYSARMEIWECSRLRKFMSSSSGTTEPATETVNTETMIPEQSMNFCDEYSATTVNSDNEWTSIAAEIKADVWDIEPHDDQAFYHAKFLDDGEITSGWSYAEWLEWEWQYVPKFGTRNCHTVWKK